MESNAEDQNKWSSRKAILVTGTISLLLWLGIYEFIVTAYTWVVG